MSRLFDPKLVYPSDDVGPYQEFEGEIIKTEDLSDLGYVHVHVDVPNVGVLSGYWYIPGSLRQNNKIRPRVGGTARIRIYNSGGGWYPDDRITGWTSPRDKNVGGSS
jgi:hypothetical protein